MTSNTSAPDVGTAIRRLHNVQGKSVKYISKLYQLDKQTVEQMINNIKTKKMNQTKEERDKLIKELAKNGLTYDKISTTLKCSVSTIQRAVHGRNQAKKITPLRPKTTATKQKTVTRQPKTQRGVSILWGAVKWNY
tara:strand:+ start:330 stop:737 length:408 start_codon:yes stop_codon:yes gene_type:complete